MSGFHENADWVRLASGIVYFILTSIMTILAIMKNRHNVRNKARGYALRYKKYINCLILMAAASFILCIGTVISIVDQGEVKRSSDGVESQYGWWISFALYNLFVLFVLGNYNHLTSLGYWFSGFLGLCSGVSLVFMSLSSGYGAWILWGTIGFILGGSSHFFVWAKNQRYYTLLPLNITETFGNGRSAVEDMALVIISWTLLSLVWFFMILSDEVSDVLVPVYLSEIFYCVLLTIHWIYISSCVVFFFIDEMYQEGHGESKIIPTIKNKSTKKRRTALRKTSIL